MFDAEKHFKRELKVQLLNYLKYFYIGHRDMNDSLELKLVLQKLP